MAVSHQQRQARADRSQPAALALELLNRIAKLEKACMENVLAIIWLATTLKDSSGQTEASPCSYYRNSSVEMSSE